MNGKIKGLKNEPSAAGMVCGGVGWVGGSRLYRCAAPYCPTEAL